MRVAGLMLALFFGAFVNRVSADDQRAQQLFDQGVAAALRHDWMDAAQKLEASLQESDRAGTHFNLVLVYEAMHRPFDLVRHALAFLATPSTEGRAAARRRTEELLADAADQVATIDLSGAPEPVSLRAEGDVVPLESGSRRFAPPGRLRVEVVSASGVLKAEVTLQPGTALSWAEIASQLAPAAPPRQLVVVPETSALSPQPLAIAPPIPARPDVDATVAQRRTSAAWVIGVLGAAFVAAAGTCAAIAVVRGNQLADRGTQGEVRRGYLSAVERYQSVRDAVLPLALTGGMLMAGAIPLGGRIARRGSRAGAITALTSGVALVGVGTYFSIRKPGSLVETAGVARTTRGWGALLIAAGLPLATFGATFTLGPRRSVRVALHGAIDLSVTW